MKSIIALALGVMVIVSLGGCREEEQGRVLQYKKGIYLGQVDKPTNASTRASLRGRTWSQAVLSAGNVPQGAGSASGSSSGSALSSRIQGQRTVTTR